MRRFRESALMGSFFAAFMAALAGIAGIDSDPVAGLFVTVCGMAYCIIFARANGWG